MQIQLIFTTNPEIKCKLGRFLPFIRRNVQNNTGNPRNFYIFIEVRSSTFLLSSLMPMERYSECWHVANIVNLMISNWFTNLWWSCNKNVSALVYELSDGVHTQGATELLNTGKQQFCLNNKTQCVLFLVSKPLIFRDVTALQWAQIMTYKGLEIGCCPIKIPRSKTFSSEIQKKL